MTRMMPMKMFSILRIMMDNIAPLHLPGKREYCRAYLVRIATVQVKNAH
jgi:hypothetical protein